MPIHNTSYMDVPFPDDIPEVRTFIVAMTLNNPLLSKVTAQVDATSAPAAVSNAIRGLWIDPTKITALRVRILSANNENCEPEAVLTPEIVHIEA